MWINWDLQHKCKIKNDDIVKYIASVDTLVSNEKQCIVLAYTVCVFPVQQGWFWDPNYSGFNRITRDEMY